MSCTCCNSTDGRCFWGRNDNPKVNDDGSVTYTIRFTQNVAVYEPPIVKPSSLPQRSLIFKNKDEYKKLKSSDVKRPRIFSTPREMSRQGQLRLNRINKGALL